MLHVYFDFSGYSDMAIGLGRIMASALRELPLSLCVRQSHGILAALAHLPGSWFRDYVYIPLGATGWVRPAGCGTW